MTISKPTWAVVATVDEHPAVVQAFVAWHLQLGADHVFIYCDRPDDPLPELVSHLPQVSVVLCDDAHWLRVGKSRPRRHQVRQARNAQDAYARTDADWLVHIDADEFLWPQVPIAAQLAQVPTASDCLVIPVAERVHLAKASGASVFEGAFRRPFVSSPKKGRAVFGVDYDLTYKGLSGHAQGKTFARTGRGLQMSIHRVRPMVGLREVVNTHVRRDELELLHFDGLTALQWTFKLARMSYAFAKTGGMKPSPHRRRQANALLANPGKAIEIYDRLKTADAVRQDLLRKHDLLVAPSFDPTPALRHWFPDQPAVLTADMIDAWLRQHKAGIVSFLLD